MKLTTSLILPAICWSAQLATAETARVYTYDPQSQPRPEPRSTTLDPATARSVLAQRAGVEDYHRSELVRQEALDAINDYGVRTPLFAQHDKYHRRVKKAILLVESDDISTDALASLNSYTSFDVSPAPTDMAIRGLFVDLVKQADPASFLSIGDTALYASLEGIGRTPGKDGDLFRVVKSTAAFEAMFTRFAKSNEWAITAFVMPAAPAGAITHSGFMTHKQHLDGSWGTYEMPGAVSPLKKRQMKEEPLFTETHEFRPVQSFNNEPVSAVAANNTTPLRGILPACFTSQSACEESTRNCTGHGSCTRKYRDNTAQKDTAIDCYVCACKATFDGKLTTNWGGPACQKKDISVQFWLIVLFTVGLVFLIGFAIGTIADMGSAELPSVLGANVSGPSARK